MVENPLQKQDSGHVGRFRRVFKSPGDVPLILRIGLFILTLPKAMEKSDLPDFLEHLRQAPRPKADNLAASVERIVRLRQPWFRLPILSARNTCYSRAITLYRFVHIPEGKLKIHFGVEPARNPDDNAHGHAWVTANDKMLEPLNPVVAGRVKELYGHSSK